MFYFRWFSGTILIALFVFILICNLRLVLRWVFRQQRASFVLIVGGIAGSIGFLIVPVSVVNDWFGAPIVIDVSLPYMLGLVIWVVRKFGKT